MDREPEREAPATPVHPETVDPANASGTPERTDPTPARPLIDVSPALHEAGHEVADLGFEGIPDSGPVLRPEHGRAGPDDPLDFVNVQLPSD